MILPCSPHAYKNPLNSVLHVIFVKLIVKLIKQVLINIKYFRKDVFDWQLKNTRFGILVSKILLYSNNKVINYIN